jgi:GTP pyrophosphokinase
MPERAIDVNWANDVGGSFTTQVDIRCTDRDGMLRDITTVLANEKVTLLGVNSSSDTKYNEARVVVTLEVKNINVLSKTMNRLSNLKGVEEVIRILQ